MTKEVLLIEQVDGLGIEGDIVKVSDGYARNYFFSKFLYPIVTPGRLPNDDTMSRVRGN